MAQGAFAAMPTHDLLLELHFRICGDLTPEVAGKWRLVDVQVGDLFPPPHWEVPELMRRYADDLDAQLAALDSAAPVRLLETLAFAEGRLLSIHPFHDYNGRVSRLFITELLRRLDLPAIGFDMSDAERAGYFAALSAYDRHDPAPLMGIWQRRFEDAQVLRLMTVAKRS